MLLRVLTLNVQNDEGDRRRQDILRRELRHAEPDLVAFQELVVKPGWNQLEHLLEGTGLQGTHQSQVMAYDPPYLDRYGGSAIATRWPHRVVEVLDQRSADAPDVPWCTLAADVTVPGLGDLLFIATTMSWRLGAEGARERQVLALSDLDARHRGALPTIIAGDFNAAPESASIRYLTGNQSLNGRSTYYHDTWAIAGSGPGYTWTEDNEAAREEIAALVGQPGHRRRIDYVFVGSREFHPRARCRVVSARLAFDRPSDGIWPSDHFGVIAEIEVTADPD